MAECIIKIEHLRKEFPDAVPLKDVSANINRGDVVAIIGPSGTGKSTLLRCINGLEKLTSGKVYIYDTDITDPHCNMSAVRKKVGMVFQSFNLFDNLNVLDNVAQPMVQLLGKPRAQARKEAMQLLKRLGMDDRADHFPDELSGGQKQRAAIARAMAMQPEVLMLDEPTSALDPTKVGEVQAIIAELARDGMTILIVTHEMRFARQVSNRVFYMDEGGIYEDGTPEQIFDAPQREKTRVFINRLQTIEVSIASTEYSLDEFSEKLINFAANTVISRKKLMTVQFVFEELAVVQLIHTREKFTPVDVKIQYSQNEQWVEMQLTYGGDSYDPFEQADEVLAGLRHYTLQAAIHRYENGTNTLIVRF